MNNENINLKSLITMNTFRKYTVISLSLFTFYFLLFSFYGCKPKNDKKAELDKLIKERDNISQQIN